MKEFLGKIRTPQKSYSIRKQALISMDILLFGVFMGVFSKYLDYRQANLSTLLHLIDRAVDLHNFLGKLAPWIVIAVCIAVYSTTPIRAGINVFVFFAGMVSSYYWYSNFIAGFFPKSYALVWIAFTAVSPFLAFLCWYAKGTGRIAFLLSSGVTGILLNCAFYYSILELFDAACSIDEVMRGKEYPDVFELAAKRLGIAPGKCIVFDDVLPAIKSAIFALPAASGQILSSMLGMYGRLCPDRRGQPASCDTEGQRGAWHCP